MRGEGFLLFVTEFSPHLDFSLQLTYSLHLYIFFMTYKISQPYSKVICKNESPIRSSNFANVAVGVGKDGQSWRDVDIAWLTLSIRGKQQCTTLRCALVRINGITA